MSPSLTIGNRWKLILTCTGINILFEYAVRGIMLVNLVLFIGIFSVYFTYFIIFEDLIVRYKLRDYQVMLIAFFMGIIIMAGTGGELFYPSRGFTLFFIFGIDYFDFLFVNIIWWSLFQTVLTFYLANRIWQRDWEHPRLGKIGCVLVVIVLGIMLILFWVGRHGVLGSPIVIIRNLLSGNDMRETPEGYISMLILVVIFGFLSYKSLKNNEDKEPIEFEPSKFLDIIMITAIILSVICAIFLINDPTMFGASSVNRLASIIVIIWSAFFGIIIIIYRLISKKEIPV